jgi:uncharacterized protein YkuJ
VEHLLGVMAKLRKNNRNPEERVGERKFEFNKIVVLLVFFQQQDTCT